MSTFEVDPAPNRRGRPLDSGLDTSILRATLELLETEGYDRLTVKDIASRAGAGLGAIYRRWPTKIAVVVAALQTQDKEVTSVPVSGDVAEDLSRALLRQVGRMEHRIPGFLSAMQHDPLLAAAVRESIVVPWQQMFAAILEGAFLEPLERDLRAEMALALPLHRLTLGLPLPDEGEIRKRIVPMLLAQATSQPSS